MKRKTKPGAGTPGNNMKQDKQYLKQQDYNSFYEAELKKYSEKYPELVRIMTVGDIHERN